MTTDPGAKPSPPSGRRRKRPHPAATARNLAASAAAIGTCALVAVFGLTSTDSQTATTASSSASTGTANPSATATSTAHSTPSSTYSTPTTTAPSTTASSTDQTQRYSSGPSLGSAGQTAPSTRSSSS